jgi:hypothetical protein
VGCGVDVTCRVVVAGTSASLTGLVIDAGAGVGNPPSVVETGAHPAAPKSSTSEIARVKIG